MSQEQLTIERLMDILTQEKEKDVDEPRDTFAVAWRKGRQDLADYLQQVIKCSL